MIVVRNTAQAKFGQAEPVVQAFTEMLAVLSRDKLISGARVLTDLSGHSDVVEIEFQVQSFGDFEAIWGELTRGNEFHAWFARIQPLVDHTDRSFFTVRR